jgi:hypothetical protein
LPVADRDLAKADTCKSQKAKAFPGVRRFSRATSSQLIEIIRTVDSSMGGSTTTDTYLYSAPGTAGSAGRGGAGGNASAIYENINVEWNAAGLVLLDASAYGGHGGGGGSGGSGGVGYHNDYRIVGGFDIFVNPPRPYYWVTEHVGQPGTPAFDGRDGGRGGAATVSFRDITVGPSDEAGGAGGGTLDIWGAALGGHGGHGGDGGNGGSGSVGTAGGNGGNGGNGGAALAELVNLDVTASSSFGLDVSLVAIGGWGGWGGHAGSAGAGGSVFSQYGGPLPAIYQYETTYVQGGDGGRGGNTGNATARMIGSEILGSESEDHVSISLLA